MINLTIITQLAITQTPVPTYQPSGSPPLSLTLMLVCTGGALTLVLGILILGFIIASQNRKSSEDQKSSSGKQKAD